MQFDYDRETLANGVIEIDEIGECALLCRNDEMEEYYLIVHSVMGTAYIFQYGPIVQDFDSIKNTSCSISSMDYSEPKLKKMIDKFINDYTKKITYVEELSKAEVLARCKSLIEYMGRI